LIIETALLVGGLSWVFDKVLEHTVGGTGHEICRAIGATVWHELTETPERPETHDVARAVRGAHLDALGDVLAGFAVANAARWERAPDPVAGLFLTRARDFCLRERGRLVRDETNLALAQSATLTA
jgi:hypothetical protein